MNNIPQNPVLILKGHMIHNQQVFRAQRRRIEWLLAPACLLNPCNFGTWALRVQGLSVWGFECFWPLLLGLLKGAARVRYRFASYNQKLSTPCIQESDAELEALNSTSPDALPFHSGACRRRSATPRTSGFQAVGFRLRV